MSGSPLCASEIEAHGNAWLIVLNFARFFKSSHVGDECLSLWLFVEFHILRFLEYSDYSIQSSYQRWKRCKLRMAGTRSLSQSPIVFDVLAFALSSSTQTPILNHPCFFRPIHPSSNITPFFYQNLRYWSHEQNRSIPRSSSSVDVRSLFEPSLHWHL